VPVHRLGLSTLRIRLAYVPGLYIHLAGTRRRGRGLRVDSCIFLTVRYTHTHLGTPAGRQPWHGCCSVVDRAAADRAALALTRSTREIGPGGPLCSGGGASAADRAVPNGTEQLVGGCKTCRVGKQGTQFCDLSLEPSVLLC